MSDKNISSVRCLVVDDDLYVRSITSYFLEKLVSVIMAASSEEALRLSREAKPHIALIDLHLPEMDGVELARALQQENPGILLILMSSDATEANVRISTFTGAKGFLAKPFTKGALLRYLKMQSQVVN